MTLDPTDRPGDARRTVLLTGASGLLGTWLRRTVPPDVDVVPVVHRRRTGQPGELAVDLRDVDATRAAISGARPDVVIHAAYAKDEASIVEATRNVAEAAAAARAEVVHVSTDSVFSGDGRPRSEDDRPDPVSDYGRWKAAAEQVVGDRDASATVVRLPLVVSLDPPDHAVAQIVEGTGSGRPSTWFTDEVRQPAMADELALAIWRIAARPAAQRLGNWHLAGPERLTRHEIALRVVTALDLPSSAIIAAPTPAVAIRPRDLHLVDDRARRELAWSPRPILA